MRAARQRGASPRQRGQPEEQGSRGGQQREAAGGGCDEGQGAAVCALHSLGRQTAKLLRLSARAAQSGVECVQRWLLLMCWQEWRLLTPTHHRKRVNTFSCSSYTQATMSFVCSSKLASPCVACLCSNIAAAASSALLLVCNRPTRRVHTPCSRVCARTRAPGSASCMPLLLPSERCIKAAASAQLHHPGCCLHDDARTTCSRLPAAMVQCGRC